MLPTLCFTLHFFLLPLVSTWFANVLIIHSVLDQLRLRTPSSAHPLPVDLYLSRCDQWALHCHLVFSSQTSPPSPCRQPRRQHRSWAPVGSQSSIPNLSSNLRYVYAAIGHRACGIHGWSRHPAGILLFCGSAHLPQRLFRLPFVRNNSPFHHLCVEI